MTNHAYLDRLTALFLIASCGGLSADHGQKRELGGVTITGGLDLIGPITEASCGGLSADHGQKRQLGGVTITGGLDLIGPITERCRNGPCSERAIDVAVLR